jgi:hypothetical protein
MMGYGVYYMKDGAVRIGYFKQDPHGLGQDGYGARYDAAGKLVEQGVYENDVLKTPLAGD